MAVNPEVRLHLSFCLQRYFSLHPTVAYIHVKPFHLPANLWQELNFTCIDFYQAHLNFLKMPSVPYPWGQGCSSTLIYAFDAANVLPNKRTTNYTTSRPFTWRLTSKWWLNALIATFSCFAASEVPRPSLFTLLVHDGLIHIICVPCTSCCNIR